MKERSNKKSLFAVILTILAELHFPSAKTDTISNISCRKDHWLNGMTKTFLKMLHYTNSLNVIPFNGDIES